MTTDERDDFARRFDEDDGTWPETWRPKPGDKLIGRLVRYIQREGHHGPYFIAVVECSDEDGRTVRWSVGLASKTLMRKFKLLRPRPGERIAIKRLEDREGGNGRSYSDWLVNVDRRDAR